jgi:DNA-binding transcriptional regulator YdaS (Cro superfamily)
MNDRRREAQRIMDQLRAERGRLSQLAKTLGLTPQAVHQWDVVPLNRVIEVEAATGISRRKLRPDYHGVPSITR